MGKNNVKEACKEVTNFNIIIYTYSQEINFWKKINSLKNLELCIISLLDNAPNNLVGCVIQKR